MPPGNENGYLDDPVFKQMSAVDQHAYLKDTDPTYKAMDGKTQGEYLSHVRGYDQPTQFEQDRTPQGSAVGRFSSSLLDSVKGFVQPAADAVKEFMYPGSSQDAVQGYGDYESGANKPKELPGTASITNDANRKKQGRSLPYRVAAFGAENLGVNPTGMEEAAERGDTAGVVGAATGQALPVLIGEGAEGAEAGVRAGGRKMAEGTRAVGGAAGRGLRSVETGELKPWVRRSSKVVGAGVGGAIGNAELGPLGSMGGIGGGWKYGPKLVDKVVPAHPEFIEGGKVAAAEVKPPAPGPVGMRTDAAMPPRAVPPVKEGPEPRPIVRLVDKFEKPVPPKVEKPPAPVKPVKQPMGIGGSSTSPEAVAGTPKQELPRLRAGTGPISASRPGTRLVEKISPGVSEESEGMAGGRAVARADRPPKSPPRRLKDKVTGLTGGERGGTLGAEESPMKPPVTRGNPSRFYHGTTEESVNSILHEGIHPDETGNVYLQKMSNKAKEYAQVLHGGEEVLPHAVVEVEVPDVSKVSKGVDSEDDMGGVEYTHSGHIKPEHIKSVKIYDSNGKYVRTIRPETTTSKASRLVDEIKAAGNKKIKAMGKPRIQKLDMRPDPNLLDAGVGTPERTSGSDKTTSFYHGTTKERADRVLKEGLRTDAAPRHSLNDDIWSGFEDDEEPYKYISTSIDKKLANKYAKQHKGVIGKESKHSLLRIDMPNDEIIAGQSNDEIAYPQYGGEDDTEVRFKKNIRPSLIKKVKAMKGGK